MTQPTLINLHPNEYSQECHYYPFAVKLNRCAGSCNTLASKTEIKSKRVQHNYRNKSIKNFSKRYIKRM